MRTTYLDLVGVTFLCLFAYSVWPPAVLAAVGVSALVISWSLSRASGDGL